MRVPGFGAKPREVETVLLETRHPKGLLPGGVPMVEISRVRMGDSLNISQVVPERAS